MTAITIRQVGPYTVTWDDGMVFCNGRRTSVALLSKPLANGAVAVVDTLCNGANGKRDQVSLQPEQYEMIASAAQARADASAAEYRRTHAAEIAALDERQRKAAAYDRGMNEGGEGYNPHRADIALSRPDEAQV